MKYVFNVNVIYSDDSEFWFKVELEGKEHEIMASLMMITRGVLMASDASKSVAYNEDGFDVCSYTR